MALRVKDVQIGGRTYRIANLQLRPLRAYREALEAIAAKRPGAPHTDQVTEEVVLASLARAGEKLTHEQLEELDGEDLLELWRAIMEWTAGPKPPAEGDEKPSGETPSP